MPTKKTYKDLDLDFKSHPITGDLINKTDNEAIRQSVKTLVQTGIYERVMHPEKGCQVQGLLFELDTFVNRMVIENTIKDVLRKFEPRIFVTAVQVYADDDYGYNISINYRIKTYKQNDTVSLFLNRIR